MDRELLRKGLVVLKQSAIELLKEIWLMLLHTLRGQYEAITGELDVVFRKQQHFREM